MSESIVPVICFCKGKILRTETYVKYIRDLAVIVPLDVPVSSTYEHLLSMIYSRTGIDKKQFQVVLNCRYPLKRENMFQSYPIWDDNSLSQMLKLVNTFGMDEIELYIEQVPVQPRVRGQLLGNFTQLLLGQNDNCGPRISAHAFPTRMASSIFYLKN